MVLIDTLYCHAYRFMEIIQRSPPAAAKGKRKNNATTTAQPSLFSSLSLLAFGDDGCFLSVRSRYIFLSVPMNFMQEPMAEVGLRRTTVLDDVVPAGLSQLADVGLPEKDRSRFANAQPGHQAS